MREKGERGRRCFETGLICSPGFAFYLTLFDRVFFLGVVFVVLGPLFFLFVAVGCFFFF